MMNVPERYRLPVAAIASLAVVAVVAVVVLLAGGILSSPVSTPSPTVTANASPTDPGTNPESATRAFFEAYANARRTDDPSLVEPFVTGTTSSAYLSVSAFLQGQKDLGKASVTTVLRLDNVTVQPAASSATVSFDYTEGGYNIDPKTGQAVESPVVLPTTKVVAVVRQVGGRWLVDSYQSR
jgi:hypothetical protein